MYYSGVVEGFYGLPWTTCDRKKLIDQFMEFGELNTYIYAPKYDLKHRKKWRELYSTSEIKSIEEISNKCYANSIKFIYGIAPGIDITYSSEIDFQCLISKITQIRDSKVDGIAILFDDIPYRMCREDEQYYNSFALAQAELVNRLYKELDINHWFFCPTVYCSAQIKGYFKNNIYLKELGQVINSNINLLWTGPEVVSTIIDEKHINELKTVIQNPIVIWDNLFANDYDLHRCFMGPYSGREKIKDQVSGILINPNCEFELNYIPLKTFSDYCKGDNSNTYMNALIAWYDRFEKSISLDELRLLTDSFYLPHELGQKANELIHFIKTKDTTKLFHNSWDILQKLSNIENRDLFYAIYKYAWEFHSILRNLNNNIRGERSDINSGSLKSILQTLVR